MTIKSIKISNFKSFNNLEINLHDFNLLIGANASGKSNFIQIFKFLKDTVEYGLDNAISLQGGLEYFRNVNITLQNNFFLEILAEHKYGLGYAKEVEGQFLGVRPYETLYNIDINFNKTNTGIKNIREQLSQKSDYSILERKYLKTKEKVDEKEKLGSGKTSIINDNGKIKVELQPPLGKVKDRDLKADDVFPSLLNEERPSKKTTLLEKLAFLPPFMLDEKFTDFAIYNVDPRLPKKAVSITGKAELEEDGSNLAIVLNNIKQNAAKRRKFYNLMHDLLPFIDEFAVDKFADTLLFKTRERYSKNKFLPASLMSDGTINLTLLIIALYFENMNLKIIEEPERNIHPYMISRIVEMMQEASRKTQIICTTHNPEMLKHIDSENIFLVYRNKEGHSCISRPIEKEEIQHFLESEMGIDELYVRNLLEM